MKLRANTNKRIRQYVDEALKHLEATAPQPKARQRDQPTTLNQHNTPMTTEQTAQKIIDETQTLLIADGSGRHIPELFWTQVIRCAIKGLDNDFSECEPDSISIIIEGPEHEHYWDAWEDVLNNATIGGASLYQDGDLWLVDYKKREELILSAMRAAGNDEILQFID